MISPREMAEVREQILALDQVAAAANSRVPKIRAGYLRQLRAGFAALAEQTHALERAAWDDEPTPSPTPTDATIGRRVSLVVVGKAPRKNTRDRAAVSHDGVPFRYTGAAYKRWRAALAHEAAAAGIERIASGAWRMSLRVYHDKLRHLDITTPRLDVDASISCVLDALQKGGVLDDDVRVVELGRVQKFYDKERPRVEIDLEEVEADAPPVAKKRRRVRG